MPSARRVLVATLACCLLLAAPPMAGAASLRLDPAWYAVVRPYSYEEARRWEPGWNRGADVVATGALARSPVAGRVRFAGSVAGRSVVTIATRIDGQPAVVTFTGLGSVAALRTGARVERGDVVGSGVVVHVGAYDPRRRTRYLPVLADVSTSPGAAARPAADRSGLADGIASRLEDAILGTAVLDAPDSDRPTRRAAAAWPVAPDRSVGARHVATTCWSSCAAPRSTASVLAFAGATERARPHRQAPDADRAAGDLVAIPRVGRVATSRLLARTGPAEHPHPGATRRRSGDVARASAAHPDGRSRRSFRSGALVEEAATPAAGEAGYGSSTPDAPGRISPARVAADGGGGEPRPAGTSDRRPWPTVLLAAALPLPLLALVAWRRRRRPRSRGAGVVHQPLPVVLPHVRPYAYPVVRSDGSSVLGDVALAWADVDPGTSPGPDPLAPARARAPEHA